MSLGPARVSWSPVLMAGALLLLGGAPAAAQIIATPPALGFSPTPVGSSPIRMVGVRNVSLTTALRIHGISLSGAHPQDFRLAPAACPPLLGSGAVCVLQVAFTPTQPGPRDAVLLVSHSGAGALLQVPLQGEALPLPPGAPRLRFFPPSVDFGTLPPGGGPAQRPVALINDGALPLEIAFVGLTGPAPSDFATGQSCDGAVIAPGALCWVVVGFSPTRGGARDASLYVISNHGAVFGTESTAPLAGRGAQPQIGFSPPSVEFGARPVGVRGPDLPLVLQNTGDATLDIQGVHLSGTQSGEFVAPAGYSCTAAPGQSCTVLLGFVPTTAATRAAELVITSNVPGAAVRVLLRGLGQYPAGPALLPTDDHRFLSSGPTLVPTCGTASSPPPNLVVPVTRVVGPVPPGGGPLGGAAGPLISAGALSATATLEVVAYNVQSPPGTPPPWVFLNGFNVGFLDGRPGTWSTTTLSVPIRFVNFPARATPPSRPAAALNVVTIAVPGAATSHCIAPAWARLGFLALSPVVMVHGNGSSGAFFARQGLAGFFSAIGIPSDSSINLAVASGGSATIAANAAALQGRLPGIAASFGVDSIHVIAHSKGGLDMRSWLGTFGTANGFRVISLTTLSSPHAGSPLADAAVAVGATGIGIPGLPLATLGFLGVGGPAMPNLTTTFTAGFNPTLPPAADYRAIGADADRLIDGRIMAFPVDEYLGARIETPALASIFAVSPRDADAIVTTLYQFMRNTATVRVALVFIPIPFPPFIIPVTVPAPFPNLFAAPNDLLVSVRSARGAPAPFTPSLIFSGGTSRDHGDIADRGVAAAVLPLLRATDTTRGDLR